MVFVKGVEEALQQRGEDGDQEGGGEEDEEKPDDEGVPLPGPDAVGELERVVAGGVKELFAVERKGAGVEDGVADADEEEEGRELERVDEMQGNLRGDQVEAETGGDGEAE